jgi:hypothetical protein
MKILTRLSGVIPILSIVNAEIDKHGLRSKHDAVTEGALNWRIDASGSRSRNDYSTDVDRKLKKKPENIVGGEEVSTQDYPFFVQGDVSPFS